MTHRAQFSQTEIAGSFKLLGLPAAIVQALDETGFEAPSRMQATCIPPLLQGRDLLAHTYTGMGKTLTFVLPLLASLDLAQPRIQALVLTPDDKTSLHVCEVFQSYARHLTGFHVLPVYHQSSSVQMRQFQRGCHVVVGTPPQVMNFLDEGYFGVASLHTLVMDEADRMLREGMSDALRDLLARLPHRVQTAIFAASRFRELELFAAASLNAPVVADVLEKLPELPHLRLRFWQVDERARIDALTRVVEIEPGFDAGLIFVHHTNTATQLRDKLRARGYAAEHVASDTPPHQRMRIAEMLVGGAADMLVATDGAVWNAPVPRFTHLINFDIPVDIESCAHRLRHLDGAGHPGTVIFLVTAREMGMLHSIEQAAGRPIKALELPERLR